MKKILRILLLSCFYIIGWFLYKNLDVEDCWKFCFAYGYGGIIGFFNFLFVEEK